MTDHTNLITPRDWQILAQAEATDGYAARMAEARRYGAMAVALEAAQSRIDFKEMVIERNAELARLAEIEADASPVEPSESAEHRDELAKRKPEPAAETVGGLAKAVKAARGGDAPPAPMRRFA